MGHGGRGASELSMEEQERELQLVSSDLPRTETRLEALALWVGAAVAFGAGVWYVQGAEKAQEFFAGYLLEQSLSVDNLFVFVLVFNYFKTPLAYQPKVLTYGIATAAVLRAAMILLGTELVQRFEPVLLVFALVLLWSAYGLLFGEDDDDEDLSDNAIIKVCRRLLPVTDHYDGDKFFTTSPPPGAAAAALAPGAAAARAATPLLLALAVIEISDVVFAVDSIPAVFGVTLDPFIVYSSNMFAILSLRSLYSFVSTIMTEMRFLDKAVAIVLAFIGLKLVGQLAGAEVPTDVSLMVVGVVLGGGVGASLLLPEDDKVE
ncbi:MAG: integral membrane protein TerC family-domain-containing protein [Monoraphidium minutum]|nr:MAG: integral membrane protein TerC family-domain-containing protein [Monoraphidium minutum]